MRSLVVFQPGAGVGTVARAVAEGLSERGEARVMTIDEVWPMDLESAQFVAVGIATEGDDVPFAIRRLLRRASPTAWAGRPSAIFVVGPVDPLDGTGPTAAWVRRRLDALGARLIVPVELFATGTHPSDRREEARATLWGRALHLWDRVVVEGE